MTGLGLAVTVGIKMEGWDSRWAPKPNRAWQASL
jgi:hypothetical protein